VTRGRSAVVVAVLLALLGAGCGGGDSPHASSSTTTATASPATGKAAYERTLVAALRPATQAATLVAQLDRRGAKVANARLLDRIAAVYAGSYRAARPLAPPADVADLHPRIVRALQQLSTSARRMANALRGGDNTALAAAAKDLSDQAQQLRSLAAGLRGRGY
jgi:hypothetical protein